MNNITIIVNWLITLPLRALRWRPKKKVICTFMDAACEQSLKDWEKHLDREAEKERDKFVDEWEKSMENITGTTKAKKVR